MAVGWDIGGTDDMALTLFFLSFIDIRVTLSGYKL